MTQRRLWSMKVGWKDARYNNINAKIEGPLVSRGEGVEHIHRASCAEPIANLSPVVFFSHFWLYGVNL